jgi:hypothetical protein
MQQISIENNTINAPVIGISSAKNAGMMMFCDVLRCYLYSLYKRNKWFSILWNVDRGGQGA